MNMLGWGAVLATEAGGAAGELQLLPETAELVWGLIAFLILFALLARFIFPRVNRMLDARQAGIQGRLEEAEALREEAEQLRRQYEEQLADARSQANAIVEDARGQAERVRQDIVRRAEEEAEQVKARSREDIDAERGRLVQGLRAQVATLSVELAGKIVQRELDSDQHRQLVDQYINELSGLS